MKYYKVKNTNRLEENKLTIWLNLELLRKKCNYQSGPLDVKINALTVWPRCLAPHPSLESGILSQILQKRKKKVEEMQNILLKWYNFSNTTNLPCIRSCLPALKPLLISVMKNFQNSKHKQINFAVYLLLCT